MRESRGRARRAVVVAVMVGSVLALGGLASACKLGSEPAPAVAQPKRFDGHGVTFDYPGNWVLEQEFDAEDGVEALAVTVESSGSGLLAVNYIKPSPGTTADEWLRMMAKGIQDEVAASGASGRVNIVAGSQRELLGQPRPTRRATLTVALAAISVPHTLEVIAVEAAGGALIVTMQGADEDLAVIEPAFAQVAKSLTVR